MNFKAQTPKKLPYYFFTGKEKFFVENEKKLGEKIRG